MVQVVNTIDPPQFDRLDAEAVNSAQKRPLYEARVKIHPKAVAGTFRSLKWAVMAVTLGIYYVAPWLRWTRPGDAPDQAILVDLAHRRFYFFFIEIWPQEFYYVAGLLIMAGIGLFLITSLFGRAWCGYACPQTVWTDLYMAVEAWAEGDRNARLKLDAAPWSFTKLRKRALKLFVWLLIAVATGGFWVFYFADAPTLLRDLLTLKADPIAYSTIGILTATTFTFAGFMREQVCTYMCPWPRIQGAMLDEHSLVVTYNAWRGEPRSGHRKKAEAQGLKLGDCVDCNACVAVCPMGIDIRDGNQLECINCALCIDACDAVMDKVGSSRGLISYSTASLYSDSVAGRPSHWHWRMMLRPRTAIYFSAWAAVAIIMLVTLIGRERFDVNVIADRNPLFVKLSDGSIRNGYTLKLLNMKQEMRTFRIVVDGLPGAVLTAEGDEQPKDGALDIAVEPDKLKPVKVFVASHDPRIVGQEATRFDFAVTELTQTEKPEGGNFEAIFHAPRD
ncbi:MAG: cytochrome c oxidase accessory protein CcoG [Rhizobiales bacterium]|nr:cytochrome c oxidase accessory protein CcoG [Hyphomicrobiales bacterium]MBI3673199.1 cytochrome c oxidase accessory protein CcoG [Hyphomicrobiales bacterium]